MSTLVKQRTFPLSKLVAATSSVSIRVRLLDLSQLLRTTNGDFYCRAWVIDLDGVNMEVVFWHVSEVIFAQLQHLDGRVVIMEAVGVRPKQDGSMGVNFTGSVPPVDSSRFPKKNVHSTICEVTEDPAYPKERPVLDSRPMEVTSTAHVVPRLAAPMQSPSRSSVASSTIEWNPEHTRPQELVQFECLACHHLGGSALPSCPMTGNPHPQLCTVCGMLQRPVLDFCPETGKPHT